MVALEPLINPYLSLYVFFDDEGIEKMKDSIAYQWAQCLANNLEDTILYTDETFDQIDTSKDFCWIYRQHDTWVVYASANYKGRYALEEWQHLSRWLFDPYEKAWHTLSQHISDDVIAKIYWGTTLFFGAEVADFDFDAQTWLKEVPLLPKSELDADSPLSVQEWGRLWQVAGLYEAEAESPHIYMVLAQSAKIERVKNVLFERDNMDLIALSLHKAYHHLQQYEEKRKTLHKLIGELDQALKELLSQPEPQRQHLSTLSQRYLTFTHWASRVTELQNTVSINANNYDQIVNALQLSHDHDHIFKKHEQQVAHDLAQIEADKVYYDAALQRVDTGLQTLRADLELRQAEKERREAKREKHRDLRLAYLGILLGITQLWPIWQNMMENAGCSIMARQIMDGTFLIIILLAAARLIWQLRHYRDADEDVSG